MKKLLMTSALLAALTAAAGVFTNAPDADTFVRAGAPTANYGGAGSLTVSGSTATNTSGVANGVADTFIRFNTAAMVSSFNTTYGQGNWVVTGAALDVTEVGAPNNAIFDLGVGSFLVRWVANTNWSEGSGNPGAPGTSGIAYGDEASLLGGATNTNLGTFTNTGLSVPLSLNLALPPAFTASLQSGGDTGLFLTALNPATGFTFNARTFGTASARPFLVVSALPQPGIATVGFSGTNLVLSATNATTNATYLVLTTTNLTLPASQWSAVLTNTPSSPGNLTLTVTNAANSSGAHFFLIRGQ